MKTADLIPIILLSLLDGDKYGIELTKDIEIKTNGKINIKQPTLYTVLKKLEKSKFITSYWEDSEIGGKRHYYKLTDNGRSQVSTLPSYDILLANILAEDEVELEPIVTTTPEIKESILPSSEVFTDNTIDTKTNIEINIENSSILENIKNPKDELFANNTDISKFTSTSSVNISDKYKEDLKSNIESATVFVFPEIHAEIQEEIKYTDYIDFKTDSKHISSKKLGKNMILKSLSTSAVLVLLVALSTLIASKTSSSAFYYTCIIICLIISIFYPIITALQYDKFKFMYQDGLFRFNIKKDLLIKLGMFLACLVIILVINLTLNLSFLQIFSINNFANLYAPIIFSLVLFVNSLFGNLYLKKFNQE